MADPDPHDVLRALSYETATAPTVVTGGWVTLIWRFATADGAHHVLRLYRTSAAEDLARATAEEAALRDATAAGLPVPRVEASGRFEGQPAFVQSWMTGKPLLDCVTEKPWTLGRLGNRFGRLQARMHAVPLHHSQPAGHIIGGFGNQRLDESFAAENNPTSFCHFDFHPLNVLAANGHPTAVIDFTTAGAGDLRLDLGLTKALLVAAPLPPSPIKPILLMLRSLFAKAWQDGYTAEAGTFPLTPLFEAAGAAVYATVFAEAVRDGRGWGGPKDVEAMRKYMDTKLAAAGLT